MGYVMGMEFIYQLIEWAVQVALYTLLGLALTGVMLKIFPRLLG